MKLAQPIAITITDVRISRVHINETNGDLNCEATLYDADGTAITSAALHIGDIFSDAWRGRYVRRLPTPDCCKDALACLAKGGIEELEAHIVSAGLVSERKQEDADREAKEAEAARLAALASEEALRDPKEDK